MSTFHSTRVRFSFYCQVRINGARPSRAYQEATEAIDQDLRC